MDFLQGRGETIVKAMHALVTKMQQEEDILEDSTKSTIIPISRVDKQRCITLLFVENEYLISKFAEFYTLSCWQKCI